MVADADAELVRDSVREFCRRTDRFDATRLHFKNLAHADKRGAISLIASTPWKGMIVAIDTGKIARGSHLAKPKSLFSYTARYLIERVSKFAVVLDEPAGICFENNRDFDAPSFRRYIEHLASDEASGIDPRLILPNHIHAMGKGEDECLCVADGLANAAYKALEPDRRWGFCETSYLDGFKPSLWKGPAGCEDIHRWGFVIAPAPAKWKGLAAEYHWMTDLDK